MRSRRSRGRSRQRAGGLDERPQPPDLHVATRQHDGDPLALAQAICKAALGDRRHAAAAFSLAGHVGRARLGALMERHHQPGRIARIGGVALALLPAAIALALIPFAPTGVPVIAAAGVAVLAGLVAKPRSDS